MKQAPDHLTSNAKLVGVLDHSSIIKLLKPLSSLSAGLPMPNTDDFERVDLNELCLQHPEATILYQAGGNSMIDSGINDGDYLIVDTQIEASSGKLIAGCYFGETLVKQLQVDDDGIMLVAYNDDYENLRIEHPEFFEIIGVVTWTFANKLNFR